MVAETITRGRPVGVDASPGWEPAAIIFVSAAGFLGMVVGLAWMTRIYQGPRGEPPRWRYGDR